MVIVIITRRIPTESASRRVHKSLTGRVRFPRPTPWRRSMGFRVEWILCAHFARLLFFFCFYNPFVSCSHTSPPLPPRAVCRTKPRPLESTRFSRSLANGEISSKQQLRRNRYDNRVSYGRIEKSRVRPFPSRNFNVFLRPFFDVFRACSRKDRDDRDTFNRFVIGRLTGNNPCTRVLRPCVVRTVKRFSRRQPNQTTNGASKVLA